MDLIRMNFSWLGVFAAVFALDFAYAIYTRAVTNERAIAAGIYASAIILLAGSAAIGYTSDPWLLIPAMCGAFCGTVLAVRLA